MDRKWGLFVIFFLFFITLSVAVTNAFAATWSTVLLDNTSKYFESGTSRSVAVDKSGNPHIVYAGNGLYYAYYDGNAWHYETVESVLNVDYSLASIAIDKSGAVHIGYYASGYLKYATNTSGTWKTETVDSSDDDRKYTSIAVDSAGKAHIIYKASEVDSGYVTSLKYATNTSGTWITETVDSTDTIRENIYGISSAVDTSGKVHISYNITIEDIYYDSSYSLKYATNASGTWTTETVDSGGGADNDASMSVDSAGKVHISYSKYDNSTHRNSLLYITNTSGTWKMETVDNDIYGWGYLAVDSSNKIHLCYAVTAYDDNNNYRTSLKYATNTNGTWTTETINTEGSVRWLYVPIAVDSAGKVHIISGSYEDSAPYRESILYITNASGTWTKETAGISDDGEDYIYMAVDSSGKVHISYGKSEENATTGLITNVSLQYTTNTSGSWTTETIDSSSSDDVGKYNSIAVDSPGSVHISYHDSSNKALKYITNASGTWTTETIDSAHLYSRVGDYSSIAVDSSGKVHIAYEDKDDLKYATNASGTWTMEMVGDDNRNFAAEGSSIVVDLSGNVHICCPRPYDNNLVYTTKASDTWTTESIATGFLAYYLSASIAMDSFDKAHILYSHLQLDNNQLSRKFTYATNTFGTWTTETVDSVDRSSYGQDTSSSLALDSSGKVHISYASGYLKYVTNTSGTWKTETVDSSANDDTSIAVDLSDKVHISYTNGEAGQLLYATNTSGKWETETIESIDSIGRRNSTALDRSDNVHISCYDSKNQGLRYFTTKDITGLKVTTGSATNVSSTSADLTGTIAPNGTTTVWFEYRYQYSGDSNYFYTKMSPTQSVSGDDKSKVTITISGLSNDTTYYYRLAAQNSIGVTYGEEKSFTVGSPSQTPTPTPTPTSTCEVKTISLSETKLSLTRNESKEITVTLTGDDDCTAEGTRIKRKVGSAGKKAVSVTPASRDADANGQATFTVTAKNKTGNAKVTFTAGKLKKSLTIKVKK